MAEASNPLKLNAQAQASLVQYCINILDEHKKFRDFYNKMEVIDIAYARYKTLQAQNGNGGVDILADEMVSCDLNMDDIVVPIIVSQVDSFVGYMADVFLSGYPIFPVVSGPRERKEAEALQAIFDAHAIQGRYARQFMLGFYDAGKYNFDCIEVDWAKLDNYSVLSSYEQLSPETGRRARERVQAADLRYNCIKRICPYNTIFDRTVAPVDVPYRGQYAGYIEMISAIELKRRLQDHEKTGNGYFTAQAMALKLGGDVSDYYTDLPQISSIIQQYGYRNNSFDWDSYLTAQPNNKKRKQYANCYEYTTIYARIIPDMHFMDKVPAPGTPQVWKLCFVNHDKLVYAERLYNIYDTLPMYFGQPCEDGFHLQTPTIAESAIPFQEGASKLMSIRLNAARRAVMDRAIYDPNMLNPSDIDSKHPAPKIPLRDASTISGRTIAEAYHQIPFDSRGTETVLQDMGQLMRMADTMNGFNQPMQGQFQRGNKSRKEWDDTMEGAKSKLRTRALCIEYQQMLPIKEQIKLNIYQYGVQGTYQSQKTGIYYKIDPQMLAKIKEKISSFKVADGFHPAEKIASQDVLVQGIQTISNSPILQQRWGAALPEMFAHMMSQGGITGLEQYLPEEQGDVNGQQPAGQPALSTPPASQQ